LPYNISSPVIFHLLSSWNGHQQFYIDVTKRGCSKVGIFTGSKNYGVPSVLLQMYAEVKKQFDVPATVFIPAPGKSSVMQGIFRKRSLVDLTDEFFFQQIGKGRFCPASEIACKQTEESRVT
jgi:16S rRNA (adenine1518-N6/adenine1519-N6)-dimethyltransferase